MRVDGRTLLLIICLVLVACGPSQAERDAQATQIAANAFATQTAEAPTATPTPACALECDVDTEGYSIAITCESGPTTVEYLGNERMVEYHDSLGARTAMLYEFNRKWTYENTQNSYTIVGKLEFDFRQNKVDYEIVVTGGAFGDTPQTCSP